MHKMKKLLFYTIVMLFFPLGFKAQNPVDTTHQMNGSLGFQFSTGSLHYPSPEANLVLSKLPKPLPRYKGIEAKPVVDVRLWRGQYVGENWGFTKRYQLKDKELCFGTQALLEFSFLMLGDLLDTEFDASRYYFSPWFKPY